MDSAMCTSQRTTSFHQKVHRFDSGFRLEQPRVEISGNSSYSKTQGRTTDDGELVQRHMLPPANPGGRGFEHEMVTNSAKSQARISGGSFFLYNPVRQSLEDGGAA